MAKQEGLWAWFQRNEKKILTGIVIGILPMFGFGTLFIQWLMGDTAVANAAIIDGQEISMPEYQAMRKRYIIPLRDFVQGQLSRSQGMGAYFQPYANVGDSEIWMRFALLKEAKDAEIFVSDTELQDFITTSTVFGEKYPYFLYCSGQFGDIHWVRSYQIQSYLMMFYERDKEGKPTKFDRKRYLDATGRNRLYTVSEFEEGVREDLMIMKLRYYAQAGAVSSVQAAYEKYKLENESLSLDVVAIPLKDMKVPLDTIQDKDLETYYSTHQAEFNLPLKKKFEYIYADRAQLETMVTVSKAEMRTFYEETKNFLFKLKPGEGLDSKTPEKKEGGTPEKKDGEAPEKKEDKPAKEDSDEDGEAKNEATPAADGGAQATAGEGDGSASGDAEPDTPKERYRPFDDKDVQVILHREVTSRKAREVLQKVMKDLAARLKSIQERIRKSERDPKKQEALLRSDIVFDQLVKKIHKAPKTWGLGGFRGYRLETVRTENFFSEDHTRRNLGLAGLRLVGELFKAQSLQISDPLETPEGFFIHRIIDEMPSEAPKFEEAKDAVKKAYLIAEQTKMAQEKAKALREKISTGDFSAICTAEGWSPFETVFFDKEAVSIPGSGENPPLGDVENVIATAFTLKDQTLSQPIVEKDYGAVLLIRVRERRYPPASSISLDEINRLREDDLRSYEQDALRLRFTDEVLKRHELEDLVRMTKSRMDE